MSSSFENDIHRKNLRWLRLDNAAKIYPAARTNDWSNVYRLSATLKEPVCVTSLQTALDATVPRFPSIAARLRQGFFWYYIEELGESPTIREEYSEPLTRMSHKEMSQCALRVIVYQNRIAVEYFHSLTDGNGAMIFLKSLLAEYLQIKEGISIPNTCGILDRTEAPKEEELEDSFLKYAAPMSASRKERTAWHLSGTPESEGRKHLTCFHLSVPELLQKAKEKNVSVTVYLCALMMCALQDLQQAQIPEMRRRKPIKVLLPVNLRNLFPSNTLRNFALYVTPELLPRLGTYTFDEICSLISHCMGNEITKKQMAMKIATNVSSERYLAIRILPLFIKNAVMKAVFRAVGETKSCLSLSNLGRITLPKEMEPYVERMDFILGVQASAPYNCGILSWKDTMYVNFIRNTKEPALEYYFYKTLETYGLHAEVESNQSCFERRES